MKSKNKILSFAFMFLSLTLCFLFAAPNASAKRYNKDLDTVVPGSFKASINSGGILDVDINYQYQVKDINIYICDISLATRDDCINSALSKYGYLVDVASNIYGQSDLNKGESLQTFNFRSNYEYNKFISGIPLGEYVPKTDENGKLIDQYNVLVTAKFCEARKGDMSACSQWYTDQRGEQDKAIMFEKVKIDMGITGNGTLNATVAKAIFIMNTYVMPVLWSLLGVLLVVRGIVLSIDIVKSSDEPEVRQAKVRGLVWLFIGVAAGYIVTILASVVMKMFA